MRTPLFDFSDPSAATAWHAIDDRVMGGLSRSTLRHDPAGHAVFEGTVSMEPNGGFASVRSSPGERGLAGAGIGVIELRGDNKQFKLSLLTEDGFDSLNYQASFTPKGTDWQTLSLPLTGFRAGFRGREVTDAPPLDPARIRQAGLMIAARQAGPFTLAMMGGLLGVALGLAIAKGVAAYANWPTVVTTWSLALSLGVSIVVGVASGLYPAMRAARLDPIEALHAE